MKKTIYTLLSAALICSLSPNTSAQTWRAKNAGLPHGFQAKTVYGEGTEILVSNTTGFSGYQMYYTPDTSTPFNYSSSSLGTVATPESHIVKCMNVLFVGSSAGIFKSHDNGVTWDHAGTTGTNIMPTYAVYSCNDTLYSSNLIGPSFATDTGVTWTALAGYRGSLVVSFNKTNGILYVGGTSSLQYTPDNGTTWNNVTTPASISGAAVADIASMGGNVYAGTNNGVYQTTDNGHTWTRVLAQSMFSLTAIDTSLLGGTAGSGIYHSDQTGTSWSQINTGLPFTGVAAYDAVNSISYNDDFAIASTEGDSAIYVVGLAELGLHPSSGTLGIVSNTKKELTCGIFPNPASNEICISIDNATNEQVYTTITDVAGRCIRSVNFSNMANNKIDLNELVPGVYFLHISQGTEHLVKKLAVVK